MLWFASCEREGVKLLFIGIEGWSPLERASWLWDFSFHSYWRLSAFQSHTMYMCTLFLTPSSIYFLVSLILLQEFVLNLSFVIISFTVQYACRINVGYRFTNLLSILQNHLLKLVELISWSLCLAIMSQNMVKNSSQLTTFCTIFMQNIIFQSSGMCRKQSWVSLWV